jgi:hypothetical protein
MGAVVSAQGIYELHSLNGTAIPSSANLNNSKSFYENSRLSHPLGDNPLNISLGNTRAFKRGEHSGNAHLQSNTRECSDWLQHQLRRTPAKEISAECGIGQRAAEGIKAGRNGLTMAHLVTICRTNPEFRAQFFAFCGGQLEGDPELVANLSRAINAVMQQRG